jgi:non-lysosomal glucosylceramidase
MACLPNVPDANGVICCSTYSRRGFLRTVGATTLAGLGTQLPALADPLDNPNFDPNMPADKGLKPEWIKALYERGEPEVYTGKQLDQINMPIGGICAGQVNLNGDGQLEHWRVIETPEEIKNGFVLRTVASGQTLVKPLSRSGFPGLSFRGEYPVAKITYADASVPVTVNAEIFSPFSPLDPDDSGLPATIFHFRLTNTSGAAVEATLGGALENGFCLHNRYGIDATRRNQIKRDPQVSVLNCTGAFNPPPPGGQGRPDIVFEDWDRDAFAPWTVDGTAFGPGPIPRDKVKSEMGDIGGDSPRLVNSYLPSHSDQATGKLTSPPFEIARNFINVWIGGGDLEGKVGVNLLIDGKPVATQTGGGVNELSQHFFDVHADQGKQGQIEIFDNSDAGWAQVGVGRITFSDTASSGMKTDKLPDAGSTALALLGAPADLGIARSSMGSTDSVFDLNEKAGDDTTVPANTTLIGALGRTVQIPAGGTTDIVFVIAWHYPNLNLDKLGEVGRYYATKYPSADAVARYVATNYDRLAQQTRLWRDTWYDSTLPYWFLDRTFLNTSTLATSGCYRFADGRFYAWEGGPGCCAGTCTHVWQYAHSMGRVFPLLERHTREHTDLGISFHPDTGVIGFRGEFDMSLAVDGQAGTILRFYREHQMAPDATFLKTNWDKIKKSYDPLFTLDPDEDGIMDGTQMNTLDRPWFGKVSWMSSMYTAACRAGEAMANEMSDADFAAKCKKIADAGLASIATQLWNGEYYISIPDPKHLDSVTSGDGCLLDQVYGQSTAFQLGLPRILPADKTRTALESIWKYNFSPDAGAYFLAKHGGRQFVNPGDMGLIMCTFPRTDWDYVKASGGDAAHGGFAYYFVETWTGNEYQVANHMFWEGLTEHALSVVRAIHERYAALKRNPWDEVECGDHYSRAMAGHGPFLAACGFAFHGPLGRVGFAPKMSPENFRAPFIGSEGWGTYTQKISGGKMTASLELKSGQLKAQTLTLTLDGAKNAAVTLSGQSVASTSKAVDGGIEIQFANPVTVPAGGKLEVAVS